MCYRFKSLLDGLFVLQTIPPTEQVMTISLIVGFSLKVLRCRDPTAIHIVHIRTVGHSYSAENSHAHCDLYFYHVVWKRSFFSCCLLERRRVPFRELLLRWGTHAYCLVHTLAYIHSVPTTSSLCIEGYIHLFIHYCVQLLR